MHVPAEECGMKSWPFLDSDAYPLDLTENQYEHFYTGQRTAGTDADKDGNSLHDRDTRMFSQ